MASAGAIAAALIAGLQLTSLASRALPAALIGAGAVAVALLCVGIVLVRAGQVLAVQSQTVTEISNDEMETDLINPRLGPPDGPDLSSYPLLEWIQGRRSSLLGNDPTVTVIIQDHIVGAERAIDQLQRGVCTTWRGIPLSADNPAHISLLRSAQANAQVRLSRIEDAAEYWAIREAYDKLVARLPCLGTVFVVAVLAFVISAAVYPVAKAPTQVTTPFPVAVYVTNRDTAPLPKVCPSPLSGQAVGGTLEHPVVITRPAAGCPPQHLPSDAAGIAVIPVTSGTTP